MVEGQFEPARSALDIFVKDMGLAGAAAEQAGAAAPLAAAARRLYVRGHDLDLGRLDDSVLIEVLRRERGVPAREDDPACPARSGNSSPGHGATRSRAEQMSTAPTTRTELGDLSVTLSVSPIAQSRRSDRRSACDLRRTQPRRLGKGVGRTLSE